MRTLSIITVGGLLEKLKSEGYPLSRPTFYRLEKPNDKYPNGLFDGIPYHRTSGNHRSFPKLSAIEVLRRIWEDVYGEEAADKYEKKLMSEYENNAFFLHVPNN